MAIRWFGGAGDHALETPPTSLYNPSLGEVSEWLKEPVSKTGNVLRRSWVRIPPSPCKGGRTVGPSGGQTVATPSHTSLGATLGCCVFQDASRCFSDAAEPAFQRTGQRTPGGAGTPTRMRIRRRAIMQRASPALIGGGSVRRSIFYGVRGRPPARVQKHGVLARSGSYGVLAKTS